MQSTMWPQRFHRMCVCAGTDTDRPDVGSAFQEWVRGLKIPPVSWHGLPCVGVWLLFVVFAFFPCHTQSFSEEYRREMQIDIKGGCAADPIQRFSDLPVPQTFIESLERAGFQQPSAIQAQVCLYEPGH